VHVPEGAVPKDGPSAGIAITSAIISALTKIPVNRKVGMTGEITLRGRVMEIGGLKEKIIAAHRAGLKTIIIPKENKKDLIDIPREVLKDLKFRFASHMDEVIGIALKRPLKLKQTGSSAHQEHLQAVLHA
jgi:ATP-dependent Lon protease